MTWRPLSLAGAYVCAEAIRGWAGQANVANSQVCQGVRNVSAPRTLLSSPPRSRRLPLAILEPSLALGDHRLEALAALVAPVAAAIGRVGHVRRGIGEDREQEHGDTEQDQRGDR